MNADRAIEAVNGEPEPATIRTAAEAEAEADARQLLQQVSARRAGECLKEISVLLHQHRCKLVVVQEWLDGQPGPQRVEVRAV